MTHTNNIIVQADSTGNTLTIQGNGNTDTFSGTLALNNNLTVDNLTSGKTTNFTTGARRRAAPD